MENRLHSKEQEQCPSHTAEETPQRCQSRVVVDQGDTEGKKNPARYVVSDTSRQDSNTDVGPEQLQLGENAAQHGEGSDSHGRTDEQTIHAEVDRNQAGILSELVIQAICDGDSEAEGDTHSRKPDAKGNLPIGREQPDVDLQCDQKQENNESQIGYIVEHRHGLGRENGLLEPRDAHHHRRTQDDSANDLRNDTGLV